SRGARSFVFSSDGKFALFYGGGLGSQSSIWDLTTGQETVLLPKHLEGFSNVAALSPGAKQILWDGGTDLRLTEVATGKTVRLAPPRGVLRDGWAVAFSPDGRLIQLHMKVHNFEAGAIELTRLQLYSLDSLRKFPVRLGAL